MNDRIIDHKWNLLLSEVEILPISTSQVEPVSTINSEDDDFVAYEARLEASFTEDYKAFCKTFGQGRFGNGWITIYVPDRNKMEIQISDQEDTFYSFRDYLQYKGNHEFVPVLNESYLFGYIQGVIFIFSKDMYEGQNLNSHIHAVDADGNVYDFGNDFFSFIKNCCLGKEIEKRFPELLDLMVAIDLTIDQYVASTFTPLGFNQG